MVVLRAVYCCQIRGHDKGTTQIGSSPKAFVAEVNYNYYRDHDPQTQRYIESDPIGLRGGINPYSHARTR
jgi:RHS repeat-associated protein